MSAFSNASARFGGTLIAIVFITISLVILKYSQIFLMTSHLRIVDENFVLHKPFKMGSVTPFSIPSNFAYTFQTNSLLPRLMIKGAKIKDLQVTFHGFASTELRLMSQNIISFKMGLITPICPDTTTRCELYIPLKIGY